MSRKVVLDTNVIQALYMILKLDDGLERLRKGYNEEQINSLIKLSKNLHNFDFYITTQIYREVELCEVKYPGILKFMSKICKIQIPKEFNQEIFDHIANLQKEYLKKVIEVLNKLW